MREELADIRQRYPLLTKNCVLLKELDEISLNRLLSMFHEEKWPKATCILNHKNLSYHFYIILSGRIKMYQVDHFGQKEVTLFILSSNDIFDLFCLLDDCEHDVYYECLDCVKVLSAPMVEVRKWYNQYPAALKNLLPYAGSQIRMLENFVSDITFTDISTRILKLLIKNVNKESNRLGVIGDLSNKEIAYLIGSTRAVVNRHLQKLKRNGIISTTRSRLEVKDLSKLIHLLELQQNRSI
ncbi:hypothetical protein BH23BAC2_BH23BAC2_21690 [soil metagenome]